MKILDSSFSLHIRRDDKYLFDYQREMKGNLYFAWEQCMSVMCQMPTGTGKTFLLVSVVWDFVQTWKLPVWIVAHRVELIEQISRTLTRYGLPHGRIVSGELVTSESVQVASIQTLAPFMKRLSGLRGRSKNLLSEPAQCLKFPLSDATHLHNDSVHRKAPRGVP